MSWWGAGEARVLARACTVLTCAAAMACGDGAKSSGGPAGVVAEGVDGGGLRLPDGGVSIPDAQKAAVDECVEVTSSIFGNPVVRRFTLDVASRIVRELDVDGRVRLASRFDDAKRLVIRAGFKAPSDSRWSEFQQDHAYDASGNHLEVRLSYPSAASVDLPSTADSYDSTRYVHTYGAEGVLLSSVTTYSGSASVSSVQTTFEENAAHQCVGIKTNGGVGGTSTVETRSYDASGRVVRIETEGALLGINCSKTGVRILSYDDGGRRVRDRFWCNGGAPDAEPSIESTTTYRPDGTQRVESIDRVNDVGPRLMVPTERSAFCAVIDAWRPPEDRNALSSTTRCAL